MKKRLLAVAFSVLLCASTVLAEQLVPSDTTDQAPKFAVFREQLEKAVHERDATFILGRVGTASLSEDLAARFDLKDPNSPLWSSLERMLELGGVWQPDGEMVVYPYIYANFPKNVTAYNHDVVLGQEVPLHHSADSESFQVGSLSHDIVWVLERGQNWSRVRTDDGVSGWIENPYLRSPLGERLGLAMVDGRWTIVFLVTDK